MADQHKAVPAQLIGHRQHIAHMVHVMGGLVARAVLGMAMTGEIQRHQRMSEGPGQGLEGGGVVQPAVQRQHRFAGAGPLQAGQFLAVGAEAAFHRGL